MMYKLERKDTCVMLPGGEREREGSPMQVADEVPWTNFPEEPINTFVTKKGCDKKCSIFHALVMHKFLQ